MSKEATEDPVHYSDWLELLGFMQEQEALGHIHASVPKPVTPDDVWLPKIRKARDYVASLPGRASNPEISDLPKTFKERTTALQGEPSFSEHMVGMKSSRFAYVNFRDLRCFQVRLNCEYADALVEKAPDPSDHEGTVRFCLPLMSEALNVEVLVSLNPVGNTAALTSQNLNMRGLAMVQGDHSPGRKFVGFAYGFGLPQVLAVEYRGAYIIKNGHHRAFALIKKGHTRLPCLVLSTDNYQFTGGQMSGAFPPDLVMSDRPPLLQDFASDAAVQIPRRRTRAVVSVHAEVQQIPL